jgi:hypothetical protein
LPKSKKPKGAAAATNGEAESEHKDEEPAGVVAGAEAAQGSE